LYSNFVLKNGKHNPVYSHTTRLSSFKFRHLALSLTKPLGPLQSHFEYSIFSSSSVWRCHLPILRSDCCYCISWTPLLKILWLGNEGSQSRLQKDGGFSWTEEAIEHAIVWSTTSSFLLLTRKHTGYLHWV